MKHVNIHPSGTPKDLQGMPASKDMRATPKNYGKRQVIGVIRNGKYINPETGEPIVIKKHKIVRTCLRVNKIGGKE